VARVAAADPDFWRPRDDLSDQRAAATKVFGDAGFTCLPTEGGCYLMVDISQVTDEDSETYAYRLLRELGVMVIPATFFYDGGKGGDTLLRIAFNRPPTVFDEVRTRLA
jgi:aminotransferase